ncbi:electron transport complex protein RnfG [Clostridium moniliforme]|uniref:Ion-translocating oxidoreductase complex subunit G n=1 Tax=Clostridium moniliforme TaxID=39489 RepID=A0ABS4F1P2_9CLOT|nr:RnfABCDGE type electron transport complex subunit G [Clostridium moniliforme]MBP1890169.1 electron transport complex protein RnfG [Clostridium moniliforme]
MANKEKKNKSVLQLGIILLIITAVAGFIIGAVYNITKEPIRIEEKKANDKAMKELLSDADKFVKKDMKLSNGVLEVNEGIKSGKVVGYDIKVASKGYGGKINIMVGIKNNGEVSGIKILSQSETAGLGANCEQPEFYKQYSGKPTKNLKVVKTSDVKKDEIKAITGATITSKAVTKGVNEAIDFYNNNLKGGNK